MLPLRKLNTKVINNFAQLLSQVELDAHTYVAPNELM